MRPIPLLARVSSAYPWYPCTLIVHLSIDGTNHTAAVGWDVRFACVLGKAEAFQSLIKAGPESKSGLAHICNP